MSDDTFATGGCNCGDIRFTIHAEPVRMAQCHCKGCQRASGTGHMSLAFFPEDAVKITGTPSEFPVTADSGNVNTRMFCGRCGARVLGKNSARAGVIAVAVGAVDDNSWFKPGGIVYNKDKPAWDMMDPDLPVFDMMPPPPPAS